MIFKPMQKICKIMLTIKAQAMFDSKDYEHLRAVLSAVGADHQDTYLNCAPYYIATGRKGFQLYEGTNSCLVVCRHPHIDECLLVFPEVGREADFRLAASILSDLTPPRNGVRLSRYTQEELYALQHRLELSSKNVIKKIEVVEESIMDWLFPIHILDTNKVALLPEGEGFSQVRQNIRNVENRVTAHDLQKTDMLRLMRSVTRLWESRMIWSKKETDDMSDLHTTLMMLEEEHSNKTSGLAFFDGKYPVGFALWYQDDSKVANLLAHPCDVQVKGLAEYQIVKCCERLSTQGINRLNIGGSETSNLDRFKKKFKPAHSILVKSAKVIYDGNSITE